MGRRLTKHVRTKPLAPPLRGKRGIAISKAGSQASKRKQTVHPTAIKGKDMHQCNEEFRLLRNEYGGKHSLARLKRKPPLTITVHTDLDHLLTLCFVSRMTMMPGPFLKAFLYSVCKLRTGGRAEVSRRHWFAVA